MGKKKSSEPLVNLRFFCPITPVVDGCRHTHHYGWDKVARNVIVLLTGIFTFKNLHQHEVKLHALQTHPAKRSKEEEVQNPSYNGASDL